MYYNKCCLIRKKSILFVLQMAGACFQTISMATIICTVECTFHLTIDLQSLKTFTYYLQKYSSFCEFYFSLCETMMSYAIFWLHLWTFFTTVSKHVSGMLFVCVFLINYQWVKNTLITGQLIKKCSTPDNESELEAFS